MKNIKYYPLMLVLIGILVFTGMIYANSTTEEEVENIAGLQRPYGPKRVQCQTATTSPEYLVVGVASSSCIVDMSTVSGGDLNLVLTASSSDMIFQWSLFYTYDDVGADRNWFPEKGFTKTTNAINTYGSSSVVNVLIPANSTNSTTEHSISISDVTAKFMKIEYNVAADNGSAYLEVIK